MTESFEQGKTISFSYIPTNVILVPQCWRKTCELTHPGILLRILRSSLDSFVIVLGCATGYYKTRYHVLPALVGGQASLA